MKQMLEAKQTELSDELMSPIITRFIKKEHYI